jgi:hypothetical protein
MRCLMQRMPVSSGTARLAKDKGDIIEEMTRLGFGG